MLLSDERDFPGERILGRIKISRSRKRTTKQIIGRLRQTKRKAYRYRYPQNTAVAEHHFNRPSIFFKFSSFCSSEIVGSFVNFPQGRNSHPPQFCRFFTPTQQSYTPQTSPPAYRSQYGLPFILRQPAQVFGNMPHSTHAAPQGEGSTNSSFQNHHGHLERSGSAVFTKYSTARYRYS